MKINGALSAILSASLLCVGMAHGQQNLPEKEKPFILDPNRPFVYLKFDHFGPGEPWGDDEPPFRIWFRFVNNCNVPVEIRTFGGPGDMLGVMDDLVAEREGGIVVTSGDFIEPNRARLTQLLPELPTPGGPAVPQSEKADSPAQQSSQKMKKPPKQPWGYDSDVSSVMDIPPGKDALFSLPANHVGEKWHFEIPFKFKTPATHCCRAEEVGGEPLMRLTYGIWDLPPAIEEEIKKLEHSPQTGDGK